MNLDKEKKGYVTVKDVLTIPEIVKNPMREYITQFMINQNNRNGDEVDFEKFLKLIDIFKNNKLDEQYKCKNTFIIQIFIFKIKVIFDLFDFNKDGKICYEDFLVNMKLFLGDSMNEEQISEIVEKTLLEYSSNQKYITFNEFVKILES
jgi:serine/threonine-protein phosphatase 2B regulatory subunit